MGLVTNMGLWVSCPVLTLLFWLGEQHCRNPMSCQGMKVLCSQLPNPGNGTNAAINDLSVVQGRFLAQHP